MDQKAESISAVFDSHKFYWMRLGQQGKTISAVNGEKIKLSPKCIFGVREIRGRDYDEIVTSEGLKFKLAISKSERLMDSAKEFRGNTSNFGKTSGKTVKVAVKTPISVKQKVSKKKPASKLGQQLTVPKIATRKPVVHVDPRKTVIHKMDHDDEAGNVKVNVSKLDFPELDDFTDDTIPDEFRRYHRIESTGVIVEKVSVSFDHTGEADGDQT